MEYSWFLNDFTKRIYLDDNFDLDLNYFLNHTLKIAFSIYLNEY